MSITVEVSLLSGKTATVQAGLDETCKTLTQRAQVALGVGKGRLLDSSGVVLDGCAEIRNSRIQSGDSLSLQVSRVQVRRADVACAAILGDGSVVTWGSAGFGGDSSAVQAQLKNVQQIQASSAAFAAILSDLSVVTWGHANSGGDSSSVQDQLQNVQQIQASVDAFAAILADGSVVTWGRYAAGGDSSSVQDQLKNVQQIQASFGAFAAILGDGSVVAWGRVDSGGDSSSVQDQLKNVQQIQASRTGAFAAILGDGSVVTWGHSVYGGDSSAVQAQLKNVQQIQASRGAFAAILDDGSVVTWGDAGFGGDSSAVQAQLKNVQQIQVSERAFAAILGDGSVVTWGIAMFGGDSSAVQGQLKNVQQIQGALCAFAAILGDGSVVTWGRDAPGGDSSSVQDQLQNVQQIQASGPAFAAILADGSVVTWGHADSGGDSSSVQDQLKNVQQIQATCDAFAAILGDGSVVTWGALDGADSSALQADVSTQVAMGILSQFPAARFVFSFSKDRPLYFEDEDDDDLCVTRLDHRHAFAAYFILLKRNLKPYTGPCLENSRASPRIAGEGKTRPPPLQLSSLTTYPSELHPTLAAEYEVRRLRHKRTRNLVALKVVEKQPLAIRNMIPQLRREVTIQMRLEHPHILRLLSCVEDDRTAQTSESRALHEKATCRRQALYSGMEPAPIATNAAGAAAHLPQVAVAKQRLTSSSRSGLALWAPLAATLAAAARPGSSRKKKTALAEAQPTAPDCVLPVEAGREGKGQTGAETVLQSL
ncbi:Aurora kinase [Symbiodinium microadriaticum]|uniref:Aurora kinase n=1 Tax=Symbiodinium microadriaticum TaxID=2951 RepID=A0A1Q9BZF5_SYMMI|nr:Aurora kinase [Symbiodinium microadriaticum]